MSNPTRTETPIAVIHLPTQSTSNLNQPFISIPTQLNSNNLKRNKPIYLAREQINNRIERRQDNIEYPTCLNQPNYVLSCWPTPGLILTQGIWSKFIFNSRYPSFNSDGGGKVDIYLYHSDSQTIATSYLGIESARGSIGINPDDAWWPIENNWIVGQNRTFPYYFIVVSANSTLGGGESRQPVFSAIQTAPPATLLASIASVSSASVIAAASRPSLTSNPTSSITSTPSPSNTSTSSALQNSSSSYDTLPAWAIALIVILGVFALVAGTVLTYFCIGGIRKRRNRIDRNEEEDLNGVEGVESKKGRNSISGSYGSQEPILSNRNTLASSREVPTSTSSATITTRTPHNQTNNPINPDSALMMAEAYRAELRKPTFHKGETGDSSHGSDGSSIGGGLTFDGSGGRGGTMGREIMNKSLEEEGQKISDTPGARRWGAQGE